MENLAERLNNLDIVPEIHRDGIDLKIGDILTTVPNVRFYPEMSNSVGLHLTDGPSPVIVAASIDGTQAAVWYDWCYHDEWEVLSIFE